MGKNELEPQGVGGIWPIAEQRRAGAALYPLQEQAGYGVGQADLSLAALYHILWAWRWLILGMVAAGIAGGVIVTLLTTPIYRSTATLELNPPAVQVMSEGQGGAPQVSANDRFFLATQYGLLQSRALAERVAQDLNLASNPALVPEGISREARQNAVVSMLAGGVSVDPVPDSRLVNVHFSSPDPQLAARVVNGYTDSFINSSLERRYQSSSYAREFLEKQIGIVRQELENSERQLVAYAQQQGIVETGAGGSEQGTNAGSSPAGDTLVALNRALSEATARRIAAEQRFRQARTARPTVEVGERTAILRNQLAALEAEYQQKNQVFQPDYPEMVQLRSRIESLQRSIRAEEGNVRAGRSGTAEAEYRAALAEEQGLQARVAQARGAVLNLRGRSIQYNILQRDVDTNRALYDALLQRYKEIGVAGGIGTSQASVVDRGQVPGAPYKPNLLLNILIGLALGFATGFGIALLLEVINDTIKTPDDVREKLRLPFLGGIPATKSYAVDELKDNSTSISEAYFSAMTSLQFTTETGAPKVLLVTSTRPAEGKSTSAWALASSFERVGNKVLLIDADMRKPAFVTGGEKSHGLANLLTSREPLDSEVVKPEEKENLWLLPCGPLPPNPAELLSSPRLNALLAEASAQYDLVIVDSPPILGLADTPLLSSIALGTLMVIEAGKTRTRAATEALDRLRQAGANVVGALLTRYKHDASGYGYAYEAYSYNAVDKRNREIRLIVSDNG